MVRVADDRFIPLCKQKVHSPQKHTPELRLIFLFSIEIPRDFFGCFKFSVCVRKPKLTASSYMHGKRKLRGQVWWETRKLNCVLYTTTEKSKDIHWTFIFVFRTCCFSVHVKGIFKEFACREPNRNVKLVIAAPAASDLRLHGKAIALRMLLEWPSNCWILVYAASSGN